jgi:hypothetical protein
MLWATGAAGRTFTSARLGRRFRSLADMRRLSLAVPIEESRGGGSAASVSRGGCLPSSRCGRLFVRLAGPGRRPPQKDRPIRVGGAHNLHIEINGSIGSSKTTPAQALTSQPCRQIASEIPARIAFSEEIYTCQFDKSGSLVLFHGISGRKHQRRLALGATNKFPNKSLRAARGEKFPVVQMVSEATHLTLGPPRVMAQAAPPLCNVSA